MKTCAVCDRPTLAMILDFHKQPVSNRYVTDASLRQDEYSHRLTIGQCRSCGLIQLYDKFPIRQLVPLYDWIIRYAEPEDHLDDLANALSHVPAMRKNSKICGISFKDDSLLMRMKQNGFAKSWRIQASDLHIIQKRYGPETIQKNFTENNVRTIIQRKGKQDMLIVRHLLEHVYDFSEFLTAARLLLAPRGYLVVEVPGVDEALKTHDYSVIWEEHTVYFTKQTIQWLFQFFGFQVSHHFEFHYPSEHALVIVAKPVSLKKQHLPSRKIVSAECVRAANFARAFAIQKEKIHALLLRVRPIAMFGAGHAGSVWVNIFQVGGYIDVAMDQNKHKIGLRIPDCRIPIRHPDEIGNKRFALCLLSSNPRNEDMIIENNRKFFQIVDTIASIFPTSKRAITKVLSLQHTTKTEKLR